MKARGHHPRLAAKGDITVRSVPRADHIVDTPTVTAIIRKDAMDDETPRIVDRPTIQP